MSFSTACLAVEVASSQVPTGVGGRSVQGRAATGTDGVVGSAVLEPTYGDTQFPIVVGRKPDLRRQKIPPCPPWCSPVFRFCSLVCMTCLTRPEASITSTTLKAKAYSP